MGRVRRLILLGGAVAAYGGHAAAYTMNFDFEETFAAHVAADQAAPANSRPPYVDRMAGTLSGNDFQISLKGSFNTEDITDVTGGQTVLAHVSSFTSNKFGTVLLGAAAPAYFDHIKDTFDDVNLTKLANGNFTIAAQTLDTSLAKLTTITTRATSFMGTKITNGLAQFGQYALYDESLNNLYGTRAYYYPGVEDGSNFSFYDYETDGADVANGATPIKGTLDGGRLTLSSPDFIPPDPIGPTPPPSAVPEATAWAMMVAGFAMVGALMRRPKAGATFG